MSAEESHKTKAGAGPEGFLEKNDNEGDLQEKQESRREKLSFKSSMSKANDKRHSEF